MKRKLTAALLGAFLVAPWTLHALASSDLSQATQPLADGVPQVAVVRLREMLAQKLPEELRLSATEKLGEALIAAGEPEAALPQLVAPDLRELPGARFQEAQALAALSRWAEALPLYQQTASDPASPFRSDAAYGRAEALRALGRRDEAIAAYRLAEHDARWSTRAQLRAVELLLEKQDVDGATRLLDAVQPKAAAERKERRLLRGRIAAKRSRERANNLYASILKNPEGAPHSVLVATLFAVAETHLQSHTPETGDDFLEEFIEHHPTDPQLPAIFAKLDQLYAAERKQSRHDLGRWSRDGAQPRRALAQWYLARANLRLGRRDLALQAFADLRAGGLPLPELAEALLEAARLQMDERQFDAASQTLDVARALSPSASVLQRIAAAKGEAEYAARRYDAAAQFFRELARERSAAGNDALFNASLAWLAAGDTAHVAAAEQELQQRGADEVLRGDLALEKGLAEASRGDPGAATALQNFVRDFPNHPRLSEAWTAFAEMAFHAAPPRLEEAWQDLARAAENHPTPLAAERADYLMIWIEDAGPTPNEARVITLAQEFLQKHEGSPLLPEVRLKLAETYYRRQDFAGAQTQFETLARSRPDSPLAEQALFFTARSAAQSMGADALDRALVLYGEVVKKNGALKWAARNEQAVIERKLGKPQDAITLYDEVASSVEAKPEEKREALCGKADLLYELGVRDPENYRRAISLYEQLANDAGVSPHWRNQALFKKGICLEKLQDPAAALATFYRVLEEEARPARVREYFWFYKAGFNAGRLLEEASKWQPAAVVYEKLAFAGGGRSEEAKERLNRLRLEHFLWEQ